MQNSNLHKPLWLALFIERIMQQVWPPGTRCAAGGHAAPEGPAGISIFPFHAEASLRCAGLLSFQYEFVSLRRGRIRPSVDR